MEKQTQEPEVKSLDSRSIVDQKSLDSRSKVDKKTTYRGYTEAQKRANDKWNKKQIQIVIRVKPEIRETFDQHLAETGEKLAPFLVRAALAQIERDNANN